jgi:ATP-binding protein involved in chromosome partitioning
LADELGVPLLGQVPLQPGLANQADQGKPVVAGAPDSPAALALGAIATRLERESAGRSVSLPIINQ